jgi:glycosyltransferase involved in cell wall biosynthesis
MRVGIYSHTPLEYYGGGEVTAALLANWLAREGWEVGIWSEEAYAGPRRLSSEEVRGLIDPHVQVGTVPFGDRKWAGAPSIWRSTLPSVDHLRRNDANLLFLPTVPDRQYLKELLARSTPAMFLLHSLTVDRSFPLRRKIVWNQLLHHLSLYALRGLPPSPRLLYQVLNDRSAALLERHGAPARQVRLIPTGVDFSRYRVGDDGGRFRVAFVGRIEEPWKGIELLRRTVDRTIAAARGPVEFVIMGSGPEEAALRDWASARPSVRYLGFAPLEQKAAELASSSAILSTSGSEPYGLTSVEGLASGLPIVSTPTAGSSYLVAQDPGFGSVSSFSPVALSRQLLAHRDAWASDPAAYRAERTARRARARARFDLEAMYPSYARCLRDLTEAA